MAVLIDEREVQRLVRFKKDVLEGWGHDCDPENVLLEEAVMKAIINYDDATKASNGGPPKNETPGD